MMRMDSTGFMALNFMLRILNLLWQAGEEHLYQTQTYKKNDLNLET